MASLLKVQIIKSLSGFTKNMTPDQVSLKVLRGKGALENIELNEDVLAEKLELPSFLKILSAKCRRISVNVPWMDIHHSPIELFVDEISIFLQLTATPTIDTGTAPFAAIKKKLTLTKPKQKHYGFAEKVIECLVLHIENVYIQFESESFGGSINLTNFVVDNRKPTWAQTNNITESRFHEKQLKQVLFFKQISWQLLRIEASRNSADSQLINGRRNTLNSPLRFINLDGGFARITIKKSSNDCSVLAGRIDVFVNEIIWTASMIHFCSGIELYKHILQLANAARSKQMNAAQNPFLNMESPSSTNKIGNANDTPIQTSRLTRALEDFSQTSHHVSIKTIEIHLTDDTQLEALPADWRMESADMEIVLRGFKVDFYPCCTLSPVQSKCPTCTSTFARRHWVNYSYPNAFTNLADMQLEQHFMEMFNKMESNPRERFQRVWPQLCSRNVVIRVEGSDSAIQCVSDMDTKRKELRALIKPNRSAKKSLPNSVSLVHMEVTSYFFPATTAFPVPPDAVHVQISPIDFLGDLKSVRWLIYAAETVVRVLEMETHGSKLQLQPIERAPEIRIELLMPRLLLEPSMDLTQFVECTDPRLPEQFHVCCSTVVITNFVLHKDAQLPQPVLFDGALSNCSMNFVELFDGKSADVYELLKRRARPFCEAGRKSPPNEMDTCSSSDELCIYIPSLWLDAVYSSNSVNSVKSVELGIKNSPKQHHFTVTLLNDFPLFAIVKQNPNDESLAVIVEPREELSLVLDHFHYIQLMHMLDDITALLDQIDIDRRFFANQRTIAGIDGEFKSSPMNIFCKIDTIRAQLLLPMSTFSPYGFSNLVTEDNPSFTSSTTSGRASSSLINSNISSGIPPSSSTFTSPIPPIQDPNDSDGNALSHKPVIDRRNNGQLDANEYQDRLLYRKHEGTALRLSATSAQTVVDEQFVSITSAVPTHPTSPTQIVSSITTISATTLNSFTNATTKGSPLTVVTTSDDHLYQASGDDQSSYHSSAPQHAPKRPPPPTMTNISRPSSSCYINATTTIAGGTLPTSISTSDFDTQSILMPDFDTISVSNFSSVSGSDNNLYGLMMANNDVDDNGFVAETAEEALETPPLSVTPPLPSSDNAAMGRLGKLKTSTDDPIATDYYKRDVNVFDVLLSDLNVYVHNPGSVAADKLNVQAKDETTARTIKCNAGEHFSTTKGYATSLLIDNRLRQNCADVFAEAKRRLTTGKSSNFGNGAASSGEGRVQQNMTAAIAEQEKANEAQSSPSVQLLQFCVRSSTSLPKQTNILAEIDGLKATLDDAVVSHLGPFVDDERQPPKDNEPALEIRLRNSDIRILNPRKKHALRVELNSLKVNDGPSLPFSPSENDTN